MPLQQCIYEMVIRCSMACSPVAILEWKLLGKTSRQHESPRCSACVSCSLGAPQSYVSHLEVVGSQVHMWYIYQLLYLSTCHSPFRQIGYSASYAHRLIKY
ncbi:hypothetical protein PHLGIDRAFT_162590 [Phlebiopsis gigantea 11061_1 CR5-6]|uniref:Uncharacterized protein n=1 Tax=Phlebiopsis gigantea (strain 11061_1 CR5-6) TaxID=745531 RepID=A0A0C3S4X5_PHLG1|nr:hypothetical protein PHLGIDRAFT_162590 [Phlebiopsis gigantea 11061_1 CR5-6]